MAEYIERGAVLNILASKNAPWDGYQKVSELPAADVVSKAAYDQVAWERHLAEVQLKSIGKSLGEKMDDVQPMKHGRWSGYFCSNCGISKYNFISFNFDDKNGYARPFGTWNYCPRCGAKMDGDKND